MAELVPKFDGFNLKSESLQLVVVASTEMSEGFECVIGWSKEDEKLIRPVTNLVTNSWNFGTFTVGCEYKFVIVDSNPTNAIYPHKSEDIKVKATPVEVSGSLHNESQMYDMLLGSSEESVSSVFNPGPIYERKYIIKEEVCPSVGILRCKVGDIEMYHQNADLSKTRCKISQGSKTFDFPVKAQNRDALMSMNNPSSVEYASNPILVLLGLGRPYTGPGDIFDPPRCYIMVIGVIMQSPITVAQTAQTLTKEKPQIKKKKTQITKKKK